MLDRQENNASLSIKSAPSTRSASTRSAWTRSPATGLVLLASGQAFYGHGFGTVGEAIGEICFNTTMTGYQEILTDPSYNGQIITFTFPHIGNVGANEADIEALRPNHSKGACGMIVHAPLSAPSSYRAQKDLDTWLKEVGITGVSGIDTRALTNLIRREGMPNGLIAYHPEAQFDLEALLARLKKWHGIDGSDLVPNVTTDQSLPWNEGTWKKPTGYTPIKGGIYKVVVVDYGVKRNMLRLLTDIGCDLTVLPAKASADEILALRPQGVFLSNGPGDPAATGHYAVPMIQRLLHEHIPIFGICLGHQMLGLAVGARTLKMPQGHHGANHPVKNERSGKVEIVSINHGFAIDAMTLPARARQTHISLFDGSNCGIELTDAPAFSVQYHPEASPGPQDSHYLFRHFVELMSKPQGRR